MDFDLTVAAAERQDVVERSVPLLPYGVPVYAAASGSATADTTVWVEPPREMALRAGRGSRSSFGPTVERSLLDVLLAPPPPCQLEIGRFASGLETATSDLMAALGLQRAAGRAARDGRRARRPRSSTPASARRSACWFPRRTTTAAGAGPAPAASSERYATARAVWALSLARRPATACPTTRRQGRRLAPEPDRRHGRGRLRDQGDPAARAGDGGQGGLRPGQPALPRAAAALGRRAGPPGPGPGRNGPQADRRELLDLLGKRNLDDDRLPPHGRGRLVALEPVAGRVAGALGVGPRAGLAPVAQGQGAGRLAAGPSPGPSLVARQGHRPGRAGPVPLVRPEPLRGREVHAGRVRQRRAGQAAGRRSGRRHADHRRAPRDAQEGRQAADQFPAHRPRAVHLPVHPGRVRAGREAQRHDRRLADHPHLRAGAAGAGRPRGAPRLRRPARQLRRVQESAHATPRRRPRAGRAEDRAEEPARERPEEQLEYLVVTEPIPSGATVVENSVRGGFERFELSPGAITFYVGNRREPEPIRYEVCGYLPGGYRAGARGGPQRLPAGADGRLDAEVARGAAARGPRVPTRTGSRRTSFSSSASTPSRRAT